MVEQTRRKIAPQAAIPTTNLARGGRSTTARQASPTSARGEGIALAIRLK